MKKQVVVITALLVALTSGTANAQFYNRGPVMQYHPAMQPAPRMAPPPVRYNIGPPAHIQAQQMRQHEHALAFQMRQQQNRIAHQLQYGGGQVYGHPMGPQRFYGVPQQGGYGYWRRWEHHEYYRSGPQSRNPAGAIIDTLLGAATVASQQVRVPTVAQVISNNRVQTGVLAQRIFNPLCGSDCGKTLTSPAGMNIIWYPYPHEGEYTYVMFYDQRNSPAFYVKVRGDYYRNIMYPHITSGNWGLIGEDIKILKDLVPKQCLVYSQEYASSCFPSVQNVEYGE